MLIVSQDKMKTTENMELWIEELWENTEFERKLFYIKNQMGTLGKYKTEERAREVLQEMISTYKFNRCEAVGQKNKVYEMPEN